MTTQEGAPVVSPPPVRVRSTSNTLLTLLAAIIVLRFARDVFVPIAIGILVAYALEPLVAFFVRIRVPRVMATPVVLLAILGGVGTGLYVLRDEASALVDELPLAATKIRQIVAANRRGGQAGTIGKFQEAAKQIEQTAAEATGASPTVPPGVTRVQVDVPPLRVRDYLYSGWQGATGLAAQTGLVLFLVYFLLLSGDLFKRKLVKIAGLTLSRKRIRVQIIDKINAQIERFLLVRLLASAIVAITLWPALAWTGLEHAVIWAIVAGLLNVIPYFGPAIVTVALAIVSLLQFGTLAMAAWVSGSSLFITSLEGWFITPKLMGRAARMNEVTVFVGLIFCGWLWGVWGLLLAVPMLMVVKTICDHIPDFQWIGELMGGERPVMNRQAAAVPDLVNVLEAHPRTGA